MPTEYRILRAGIINATERRQGETPEPPQIGLSITVGKNWKHVAIPLTPREAAFLIEDLAQALKLVL